MHKSGHNIIIPYYLFFLAHETAKRGSCALDPGPVGWSRGSGGLVRKATKDGASYYVERRKLVLSVPLESFCFKKKRRKTKILVEEE